MFCVWHEVFVYECLRVCVNMSVGVCVCAFVCLVVIVYNYVCFGYIV